MGRMKKYINIVDDEPDILKLVTVNLEKAGYETKGFLDAGSFRSALEKRRPDLIILDLMLPDQDGMEVCKNLKRTSEFADIPVIMLTAKGLETDKIAGLELGADDYVTKPFSPKELVARVKAVLRRSGDDIPQQVAVGEVLVIDPEKFEVRLDGSIVKLTAVEFKILHMLSSAKGKVFSRESILDHLWGNEKAVLDRTVDVHIRNIREKLGPASKYIKNIRGIGYKVEE